MSWEVSTSGVAGEFTHYICHTDFRLMDHKGRRVGSKISIIRSFNRWYMSVSVTRDRIPFGREAKLLEFDSRDEAEKEACQIVTRQRKAYLRRPHRFTPVD